MTPKRNIKNLQKKSTYPLLESIALEDGQHHLLPYHQKRIARAFQAFWPSAKPHQLEHILAQHLLPQKGLYKLRFLYSEDTYQLEIHPYKPREIKSLAIQVLPATYQYTHKYTDRTVLTELKRLHAADEVLFFRQGLLMDAYYYNVLVLKDQELFTPKDPLLQGCMRASLLDKEKIIPLTIDQTFLKQSEGVYLINALNPIHRAPFVQSDHIQFD